MPSKQGLVPVERIERAILLIRGQKVGRRNKRWSQIVTTSTS